ncbi:CheY-like superfamily [Suillus cothurnatus]|nr:CheY-like superfamily [Suillus cothurnatus]
MSARWADKERLSRNIDTILVDSLSGGAFIPKSVRKYDPPALHSHRIISAFDATSESVTQDLASALISALEPNAASPVLAPNVVFDILLAEDNMVNQKLAVKILEKYGHTVEIAENGSLAVEAFKARVQVNKPFDIILMDVSMPFMGGMEATELIRAYEMHKRLLWTPIIALTAHAMIGDRERCLQAGMNDHITKPLRCGDLLNLINKLAGERAQLATQHHLFYRPSALMAP